MATVTANLTPKKDQTPAIVSVKRELSGKQWCGRFPGSISVDDLADPFKTNVSKFISALDSAKANYRVSATYRPKERAYLMHWSWMIANGAKPSSIPTLGGVNIEWAHETPAASKHAAIEMTKGFDITGLKVAPALESRHTARNAIDITISWPGELTIVDATGKETIITTDPKTGMNTDLHIVGKSYGVVKFLGGNKDRPHWSNDGH